MTCPQVTGQSTGIDVNDVTPRRLNSRELFTDASIIEIEHKGEIYQLRITRHDKLILTK